MSTDIQSTPNEDLVLVDDRGDFAVLTINRPEKRNAMSLELITRMREAFREVKDKKVVVLTGTGKSFCAGVDIADAARLAELERAEGSNGVHPWTQVQHDIRSHKAIFIAAVNGYALGGGSTLINNCELAIAGESAAIAAPEMGFGAWPMQAGPASIKRLAPKHAAEFIFTARRFDAANAYRVGLVNQVVPDAELADAAIALAEHIAAFDGVALDYGKKAYHRIQELDWDDAFDYSKYTSWLTQVNSDASKTGAENFLSGHRGPGQGA
ncbi:MAG: enoyl-CoA hydratase/isomerase family protein [Mycetocola sp.]